MYQYLVLLVTLQLIVFLVTRRFKLKGRIKNNMDLGFLFAVNLKYSEDYDDLSYTHSRVGVSSKGNAQCINII